ncbi:MAG TPA: DNA polymerase IV, partial [Xanthomonadaceae bacterium]|nr:DNA polymerase IV [Xanthomonadaceae bacterium]
RLCPDAVFVPPDFVRYRDVSRKVRAIFARHTALIEPLSLDEAYLDVTSNALGLPSATAVAESIRSSIREELHLTASAGVAPNKFLAKIASDWRKPDGLFVIRPEQALDFLAPLPVARLPGVGKVMEQRLTRSGFRVVADLRGHAVELERHFGRWGRRLHELAHGIDEHPVESERPTQSVSAEDTFAEDLQLDQLAPHIERLAGRTWAAARKESRVARTVVLKLKTAHFRVLTRSVTPPVPVASERELTTLACALRERVELPSATRYRLVGVGLGNFRDADEIASGQAALFE